MHTFIATSLLASLAVTTVHALPRVPALQARQDVEVDTYISIGDVDIVVQDRNANPGESPQAFAELFDYLESDLCGQNGCQFNEEYCVDATAGQEVCIEAEGSYDPALRSAFMGAVRGAFDRTVRHRELSIGVMEIGTDMVHVTSNAGTNSGWDVRVQLSNKSSGGGQCGAAMETIIGAGAFLPEIGKVFGMVGFACGRSNVQWVGEATG